MVQATEPDDETDLVVEIVDGAPTIVRKPRQPKLVFEDLPLIGEDGKPVMTIQDRVSDILGPDGHPTVVGTAIPVTHPVAVMVEEEYTEEVDEPAGDRLGLRYDQLALFMLRGLASRVDSIGAWS
jgi:hypothetical protein